MTQAVAAINSSWIDRFRLRQHWFCHRHDPN